MMKHDDADQNQPFMFKSTLGNFLHSIAYFYMWIALGCAIWWPNDNRCVVGFLLYAMVIHTLLAANSRLLFSIFAFLVFGVVLCELFGFFYWLLGTKIFDGLPLAQFFVTIFCHLFVFTVIITTQIYCSTAFLKLSLFPEKPKSKKSRKCRRRHGKNASASSSSSGESEKPNPIISNSCSSHTPPTFFSTNFSSIGSSVDSSVKNT